MECCCDQLHYARFLFKQVISLTPVEHNRFTHNKNNENISPKAIGTANASRIFNTAENRSNGHIQRQPEIKFEIRYAGEVRSTEVPIVLGAHTYSTSSTHITHIVVKPHPPLQEHIPSFREIPRGDIPLGTWYHTLYFPYIVRIWDKNSIPTCGSE